MFNFSELNEIIEFSLLVFTSLFTVVDPIGLCPIYLSMTNDLSNKESKKVARKSIIIAFLVMIFFALTGKFLFSFFDISVNSFQIVGGIIFFIIGFDMIGGKVPRTKNKEESPEDFIEDISISPIAVPLICGPGAITVIIVMIQEAQNTLKKIAFFSTIILICWVTYFFLISAKRIYKFLGQNGNKLFLRLMGLILMVIAVEFFFKGLKGIL